MRTGATSKKQNEPFYESEEVIWFLYRKFVLINNLKFLGIPIAVYINKSCETRVRYILVLIQGVSQCIILKFNNFSNKAILKIFKTIYWNKKWMAIKYTNTYMHTIYAYNVPYIFSLIIQELLDFFLVGRERA